MGPTKRRVLIVDDEGSVLGGMRCYFEAMGYEVDCASEPEEAEALLDHEPYDCLVADLCLTTGHGPDGLGVISHARAVSPRTRILVLTAVEEAATRTEAYRLGADAYLHKPVALSEVLRAVQDLTQAEP